ncbi:MAG: choice-of-anchor D domain-containing protein [Thermomicrobiales bacterium]
MKRSPAAQRLWRVLLAFALAVPLLGLSGVSWLPGTALAEGPNAVQNIAGCNANSLGPADDGSSPQTPLGFTANFFGTNYTKVFVNNNGNVTFDAALRTYTASPIQTAGKVIIAPFWADVDTRGAGSTPVKYGTITYNSRAAFCVNWVNVGYFSQHTDKLNSFQLILVDRSDTGSNNFDIIMNYDKIQWETGDFSGGTNGLGGSSARVGYSNGSSASFELPGSAVNGAFLDSNAATGLSRTSRNSAQTGRNSFQVRSGAVQSVPASTTHAWGDDATGELGDGTIGPDRPMPMAVPGGNEVKAIAGGYGFSLGLKADGTVIAWGTDDSGELGDGQAGNPDARPTAAVIPGLTGVVAITAGGLHAVALKSDGTLVAWGFDFDGQLGDGTPGNSQFNPVPVPVPGMSNVVAIAGGTYFTLALKSDGTVWAWGNDAGGQLGDGTINSPGQDATPGQVSGLSGITAIAAGAYHSLALKSDGTVFSWGRDAEGQLGDGTIGPTSPTPTVVPGLSGIAAIAAGQYHSLALKNDGTVLAWGSDASGQLGDGTVGSPTSRATPQAVTGLSGVSAISAGEFHSLALKTDGTLRAWGGDDQGQLGDGTIGPNNPTPAVVPGVNGAVAIAAGHRHSLALYEATTSAPSCLTPASIDFGTQVVGNTAPSQLGILNNCGNSALAITTTTLGGTNAGDFDIVSSCAGTTIQVGSSCGIRVAFHPAGTGARTATVTVNYNGGSVVLNLSGIGATPVPPFNLTILTNGNCTVNASPGTGPFQSITTVTLTPQPAAGWIFIYWRSERGFMGWADPWTFQMDADHTVTAYCVPLETFTDYSFSGLAKNDPIIRMTALKIIRGYGNGKFGPNDTTQRAQMAALICRGMGYDRRQTWDQEDHGNPFIDRGGLDANLWRNVGTLYYYNVGRGYDGIVFGPTDGVNKAQTISFFTRAMILSGYWVRQPDNPNIYPNVPGSSGHRSDIATYVFYVGTVPGTNSTGQSWGDWNAFASRAWFSQAEWKGLNDYFSQGYTP